MGTLLLLHNRFICLSFIILLKFAIPAKYCSPTYTRRDLVRLRSCATSAPVYRTGSAWAGLEPAFIVCAGQLVTLSSTEQANPADSSVYTCCEV